MCRERLTAGGSGERNCKEEKQRKYRRNTKNEKRNGCALSRKPLTTAAGGVPVGTPRLHGWPVPSPAGVNFLS
jgi:hypothetical protein